MTIDTSKEAVERLARDCDLCAECLQETGSFPTGMNVFSGSSATMRALAADRDAQTARADAAEAEVVRLTAENDRLLANTTRFPELMAMITAEKDLPLDGRIERIKSAMALIPDGLHRYQWEADVKQYFGERTIRSVAGNDGRGLGRQAIASVPHHLTGVAEFIAAANPDTIAMMIVSLQRKAGE